MRVGNGFDAHPLQPGRKLILGGVHVPYEKGLAGHSDSDVATHAIIEALLGASGAGDIGRYFPPSDARYKDVSSLELLAQVRNLLIQRKWRIGNIDVTIVAERPRLSPYVPEIRKRLAAILRIDEGQVNVKSKSTNGLGYEGKGEGISAYAVALLEPKR